MSLLRDAGIANELSDAQRVHIPRWEQVRRFPLQYIQVFEARTLILSCRFCSPFLSLTNSLGH